MKVMILNQKVRDEVYVDKTLFVLWRAMYGLYDSDIDAFHNKHWVRNTELVEEAQLQDLKSDLARWTAEYEKETE